MPSISQGGGAFLSTISSSTPPMISDTQITCGSQGFSKKCLITPCRARPAAKAGMQPMITLSAKRRASGLVGRPITTFHRRWK